MNAIVLSAGKASRFGLPKFLLPAGEGHTLLTRAVETALRAVDGGVAAVIGRDAVLASADLGAWVRAEDRGRVLEVENPDYAEGLSTSLRAGIGRLGRSEGILVLLADQPAMNGELLGRLVQTFLERDARTWAVAAAQEGETKPPVVFDPGRLSDLGVLRGDQGLKPLLKADLGRVQRLEFGRGDWATDVDDWATYADLAKRLGWHEEAFEPVEGVPEVAELNGWLEAKRLPPAEHLALLRRAVLTLLNGTPIADSR